MSGLQGSVGRCPLSGSRILPKILPHRFLPVSLISTAVTESKLTLLAARLVNEPETRCWDQEKALFGSQLTMKMECESLKITILSGPGCQVLSWVRDGVGRKGKKQSKKTIQSLQMSPRMAGLRQGKVLV